MLRQLVGFLKQKPHRSPRRGQVARWIGRNWARVSYGYRIEPTWLELNRLEIPIPGLAPEFSGFRIAQLSDFHASRRVTPAYLGRAVDLAMDQQPQLIVLTGDFVHRGYRHVQSVARSLGRLSAPHGVYAVLGNHDFSTHSALGFRLYRHLHRAVAQALRDQGIQVLQNESVLLCQGTGQLYLTGVEDLWSRVCDLDRAFYEVSADIPNIVLAHNPRTIEQLNGRRCDLMLSGHTHGGQIKLPGLGTPTLGKKARRFAAGLYRFDNTHIYVNKGVGFGFQFRYGVRPEVAVFQLQPAVPLGTMEAQSE